MTTKTEVANDCKVCDHFIYQYMHDAFEPGEERPDLAGTLFFVRVPSPFDPPEKTEKLKKHSKLDNACVIPGRADCPNFKPRSKS